MDNVFEYKKLLCSQINMVKDNNSKISFTLEDFLYIILSDNPSDNEQLQNVVKKVINSFRHNMAQASIGSLKKIISYTNQVGLNEQINKEIYNLLIVYQVINKNEELLKEEFDSSLAEMNNNLINNYNIEKQNIINEIIQ